MTPHHTALETLRELAPAATICAGERFIDNGKIIVGAGIAAGIGYLGSCCGAGPEHVGAMAAALGK